MKKSALQTRRQVRRFEPPPNFRRCDMPGCAERGEHRAPKGRDRLHEHYWFCLEHVRLYNAAWNYYAGMTVQEIEQHVRADSTWRRPSWPLSGGKGKKPRAFSWDLFEGFGILDEEGPEGAAAAHDQKKRKNGSKGPALAPALIRALAIFDLDPPVDLRAIKARYKELVKRHHPDANGGDKKAEERLKLINEAYATLRQCLT